jgi:hypothetical protein
MGGRCVTEGRRSSAGHRLSVVTTKVRSGGSAHFGDHPVTSAPAFLGALGRGLRIQGRVSRLEALDDRHPDGSRLGPASSAGSIGARGRRSA